MIKSFRGKLADGGQDTIRLGTNKGLIGYRIIKFQVIASEPVTGGAQESVVQAWTVKQDAPSTTAVEINFANPLLLGVSTWSGSDNPIYQSHQQVIFDHVKFNQDIYVTHTNTDGSGDVNYYLELEQVKLSDNEAAVATLKDMRGS